MAASSVFRIVGFLGALVASGLPRSAWAPTPRRDGSFLRGVVDRQCSIERGNQIAQTFDLLTCKWIQRGSWLWISQSRSNALKSSSNKAKGRGGRRGGSFWKPRESASNALVSGAPRPCLATAVMIKHRANATRALSMWCPRSALTEVIAPSTSSRRSERSSTIVKNTSARLLRRKVLD